MPVEPGRLTVWWIPVCESVFSTAADRTLTQRLLILTDRTILAVALIGLLALVVRWFRRGPGHTWDDAPVRLNSVREDAVAMAILAYLCAALVLSQGVKLIGADPEGLLSKVVIGNGAHFAVVVACVCIGVGRYAGGVRTFLFGGSTVKPVRMGLVMAGSLLSLGICPLVRNATAWVLEATAPGWEFQAHPTLQALHEGERPLAVIAALWVGAGVIAPVAEELFFRGLLQTCLLNLSRSRWFAILGTSIAFGAVHYSQLYAVAALAVLGVILGAAYERTGSLLPPVLIHMVFNVKTLVWDAAGGVTS
jgi:membrane protease YdiL (CAAX protease family)